MIEHSLNVAPSPSAVIATFSVSWGKLTDNDLTAINGSREQLEGKIQQRYGIAKDQARKEIDDWFTAQGF